MGHPSAYSICKSATKANEHTTFGQQVHRSLITVHADAATTPCCNSTFFQECGAQCRDTLELVKVFGICAKGRHFRLQSLDQALLGDQPTPFNPNDELEVKALAHAMPCTFEGSETNVAQQGSVTTTTHAPSHAAPSHAPSALAGQSNAARRRLLNTLNPAGQIDGNDFHCA